MRKSFKKFLTFALAFVMCFGITSAINTAAAGYTVADAATADSYYGGITATGGNELLGQLHDLITSTHTTYSSYNDCHYKATDTDPGSGNNTVMEFYTHQDIDFDSWDVSGGWNREHVWPKSISNNLWKDVSSTTKNGGTDLHHIRPAEKVLNADRGNQKYGEVSNGSALYQYGTSYVGGYSSGGTFEPLDNVKGDVARIIMYVYTHYNTYSNSIFGGYAKTDGPGSSSNFGTLNLTLIMTAANEAAAKKLLLEWNRLDPVDEIETKRQEAVYAIQKNRNPFIDHPEYADAIWGDGSVVTPAPTLTGIAFDASAFTLTTGQSRTLTVIPTPGNVTATVNWTSSNTSVATVANGKVTAAGEGTATITATSVTNSAIKATATVTVIKSSTPQPSGKFEAGTYKLALDITAPDLTAKLYFTGALSGNYGATTADGDKAAVVTAVSVNGGYTLETGGKYLEIEAYENSSGSTSTRLVLVNASTGEWSYDSDLNVLTWYITRNGKSYYLGSYTNASGKTFETISSSETKYISGDNASKVGVSQFPVSFEKVGGTPSVLESITIDPSAINVTVGNNYKLSYISYPSDAAAEVGWTSSDNSVATVSADGTVTAIKAGVATITATSKTNSAIKATATVTVTSNATVEPALTGLTVTSASLSLTAGNSGKLTVNPVPSGAKADVNWTSTDNSVATVSADGTVTAIKAGTATITATSKTNSSIKASVTVTVVSDKVDDNTQAFTDAVAAAVESNGTLSQRRALINTAITEYNKLTAAEKSRVAEKYGDLIAATGKLADDYNAAAENAEKIATGGII